LSNINDKKVLECSSKGDKRFSAMYAKVNAFGVMDTIENHYQQSKRNATGQPVKKGQPVDHVVLNRRQFSAEMLTQWYRLLWIKYLSQNPDLIEYASQFDEFTDMFRGKNTINCQADVIRDYVTDRAGLIQSVSELTAELKSIERTIKIFSQKIEALITALDDGTVRVGDLDAELVSRFCALIDAKRKNNKEGKNAILSNK